ncbi:MAG: conserved rane protein of unknown function, partial [Deltaproteobacteria bacterium]|nr:conserved rane protein of unknown function [Deltaproteobacteria bacterium]
MLKKGGSNAAFFLLLLVAIVDTGKLFPLRLGILRLAVFAWAAWSLWRDRSKTLEADGYALPVAGFVLLSLGHAFSSVYFWVSMQHALNIAMAALILCWAYRSVRRDPDAGWDGIFFSVCAVGIVQIAVALFQRWLEGNMRPRGTFDNTNFFAEFMAVAAILCLARCFGKEDGKGKRIAGAAGVLLFSYAAFVLSASRAVFVAAVPAVAIFFFSRFGWRRGGMWLLAGGLPVLAALGYRIVAERFANPDPYNYARLLLWESAGKIFLANPFGVGLGGFKFFWYSTQGPVEGAFMRYGKFSTTAHNEFLEILSGLGVVGLVLFALVLFVPLFRVWRRFGGVEEGRRWAVRGATCGLIVSGAHAVVDFNFHEMGLVVLDAVLLGGVLASLPENLQGIRIPVPSWGK